MKMKRLGTLPDCSDVLEVMIANGSGMSVSIMSYGAVIMNLSVPGEEGQAGNVVLRLHTMDDCRRNPTSSADAIAQVANRIRRG